MLSQPAQIKAFRGQEEQRVSSVGYPIDGQSEQRKPIDHFLSYLVIGGFRASSISAHLSLTSVRSICE